MKKKISLLIACLLLPAVAVFSYAAGGASDPLVSLSYLNGDFTSTVESQVDQKLDASDAALLASIPTSDHHTSSSDSCAVTWTETRLKEGDVLRGSTGTNVLVLAGYIKVSFSSGAVVDVTDGTTVASGSALSTGHRYMAAEDSDAVFTVTSKTAVVTYQGNYVFGYAGTTDYNAIAGALKTLHLFKGTFTGYGEGYDLEATPTRLQALIMFIRVLGEEDAALSYTESVPFTDIAKDSQGEKYVGYAYSKGYTNGYSATLFKPSQSITASQYMEFMLRALGYSSTDNKDLSLTLTNARNNGVITAGEFAALQDGSFLRADLVYVSYYALDAIVSGSSQTLQSVLLSKGVFTQAESIQASNMIPSDRK